MIVEPHPAELRDEPFIWVTWLAKLISEEAQCEWALWFRARHTFIKMPSGSDLEAWTKEHNALVQWRARELRAAGLIPRIEQSFTINGRTATIKGKADIVYEKDGIVWVEECKTGKRRDADLVQALIYVWLAEIGGQTKSEARVIYKDGLVDVDRGRLPEIRAAALRLIALTTAAEPPLRAPSQQECRSCNIGSFYCEERVGSVNEIFATDAF